MTMNFHKTLGVTRFDKFQSKNKVTFALLNQIITCFFGNFSCKYILLIDFIAKKFAKISIHFFDTSNIVCYEQNLIFRL